MHSRAKEVENCYVAAEATKDGVRKNVITMTETAKSLSSLYDAVSPDGELSEEQKALITQLDSEYDAPFWSDVTLAKKLHDNSEAIYNRIYYAKTDSEIKDTAKQLYETVDECYKLLGSETDYTEAANDYNRVVSRFPVSLFSHDRAPVFEKYYNDGYGHGSIGELATDEDGSFSVVALLKNVVSRILSLSLFKIALIVIVIIIVISSFVGRGANKKQK